MKKSEIAELLRNVKSGKVKIDDAITTAETSRKSLVWEKCQRNEKLIVGFLYKVSANGEMEKLPEKRNGKIFQPYYRSIESMKKAQAKAQAKKS